MKNNELYTLNEEDMQIIDEVSETKTKPIMHNNFYKIKTRSEKKLTSNVEDDIFYNNPQYKEKTLQQEQYIFKTLKLYYYPEAIKEDKLLYLSYFCEIHPWLLEKLKSNITKEEKNKIFNKALEIAKKTKNDFVAENTRLIMSIVSKYYSSVKIPKVDLIQEGTFGIETAVKKYDLSKKCKFSSYATQWVRHTLNRYNENYSRSIRLPNRLYCFLLELNKVENDMTIDLKRTPTNKELAKKLDVSIEKVIETKKYREDAVSLDATINSEEEEVLGKFLQDQASEKGYTEVESRMLKENFNQILENLHLSERTQEILYSYYGTDKPVLQRIAKKIGISRETARKVKNEGLKTLKESKQLENLAIDMGIINKPETPKTYTKKI